MRGWLKALSTSALVVVAAFGFDAVAQESQPARAGDPARRNLDSYRLSVGDEVEVTVYQGSLAAVLTRKLTVPANGMVSFPPVGKLDLLGKTAFEIEEVVSQRLKEENYLTAPNVGCIVTNYAPRYVSVIGAVQRNVPLPIHKDLRILELLAYLNTLESEGADFAHVGIRRVGANGVPFRLEVNVDAVYHDNDEQQNVIVREGDIINIPRLESVTPQTSDFVYVLGKVSQRGRIAMPRSRTPFTLVRLIAMCGDFTEYANRSKVQVIRITETGRKSDYFDFDDILDGKRPDFELRPDDVIFVPESFI